ncbi:hypothetical protein K438DRAFT_2021127 [Mycena galopus ATCC 62051]|nr:hypothetical protein K438DRAFT_2021127 [Mycena galopus ATCC 62051]
MLGTSASIDAVVNFSCTPEKLTVRGSNALVGLLLRPLAVLAVETLDLIHRPPLRLLPALPLPCAPAALRPHARRVGPEDDDADASRSPGKNRLKPPLSFDMLPLNKLQPRPWFFIEIVNRLGTRFPCYKPTGESIIDAFCKTLVAGEIATVMVLRGDQTVMLRESDFTDWFCDLAATLSSLSDVSRARPPFLSAAAVALLLYDPTATMRYPTLLLLLGPCPGGGFLRMDLPGMGIVTADDDGEGDDGPSEGECRDITAAPYEERMDEGE